MESGPLTRFVAPEQADELARAVLSALEITPETADKLHDLSWEQVVAAQSQVLSEQPMSMQTPGFPSGFWPVLDDHLIPAHVVDPKAVPSSRDVPLLIGQNGTEFTLIMLGDTAYSLDKAGLEQRVEHIFGAETAAPILASYRRDFPDYDLSGLWVRIFSDYAMGTLSSAVIEAWTMSDAAPVYSYRFDWQTPIDGGKLYSPHTIEIPFVFANANVPAGQVMTQGGPEVADLAETVSSAWVAFARHGRPSAPGLPDWPAYTQQRQSMRINTRSRVGPYMDPDMDELFHNKLWKAAGLA
ncbi:carboxylesterase family protein [Salinisphaera sp. SPP-AMP-43]|uniref:carboxylesterase family protein n=1 Tax=Salinisphaera sp. SPP-AMP-43 TaxID=3121288 RepID=UPI003C6E00C4